MVRLEERWGQAAGSPEEELVVQELHVDLAETR